MSGNDWLLFGLGGWALAIVGGLLLGRRHAVHRAAADDPALVFGHPLPNDRPRDVVHTCGGCGAGPLEACGAECLR